MVVVVLVDVVLVEVVLVDELLSGAVLSVDDASPSVGLALSGAPLGAAVSLPAGTASGVSPAPVHDATAMTAAVRRRWRRLRDRVRARATAKTMQ